MATTEKALTATGAKVTTVVTEHDATAAAPAEPAAGAAGWIVVGGVDAALAGAKPGAHAPVDCRGVGVAAPAFADDFGAFVDACADRSQLFNTCKRGPCGKVCASTMTVCNGCGGALPAETIQTNNVFMGFVHGVRNGPFPFKISLRAETDRMMVFDDPLAITRAHMCAVPTDCHVPDMRSLLARPARGLALLDAMDAAAWAALERDFLDDAAFAAKALSPAARALPRAALRGHVIAGLNFPPSQFQIHLQYMLPPLTPFHASMYKRGAHYSAGRFFPLEYVRAALAAMVAAHGAAGGGDGAAALPWDPTSCDADAIIARVRDEYGVDYEAVHAACYARYGASHALFANYDEDDFEYLLLPPADGLADAQRVLSRATLAPAGDGAPAPAALEAADKLALQNYGRPYGEGGKPGGVYYSHAKPAPLPLITDLP